MVLYITMNGISDTYGCHQAFTLRYRRVNGAFYGFIKVDAFVKSPLARFSSWFYILRYLRTGVTMHGKSDS